MARNGPSALLLPRCAGDSASRNRFSMRLALLGCAQTRKRAKSDDNSARRGFGPTEQGFPAIPAGICLLGPIPIQESISRYAVPSEFAIQARARLGHPSADGMVSCLSMAAHGRASDLFEMGFSTFASKHTSNFVETNRFGTQSRCESCCLRTRKE